MMMQQTLETASNNSNSTGAQSAVVPGGPSVNGTSVRYNNSNSGTGPSSSVMGATGGPGGGGGSPSLVYAGEGGMTHFYDMPPDPQGAVGGYPTGRCNQPRIPPYANPYSNNPYPVVSHNLGMPMPRKTRDSQHAGQGPSQSLSGHQINPHSYFPGYPPPTEVFTPSAGGGAGGSAGKPVHPYRTRRTPGPASRHGNAVNHVHTVSKGGSLMPSPPPASLSLIISVAGEPLVFSETNMDWTKLNIFRTRLCDRLTQTHSCHMANRCLFSHDIAWPRRTPFLPRATSLTLRYIPVWCPRLAWPPLVGLCDSLGKISWTATDLSWNARTCHQKCTRGDNCPFVHNAEELLYHPELYKTRSCCLANDDSFEEQLGSNCVALCPWYFCPFAHDLYELRDLRPARQAWHLPPQIVDDQFVARTQDFNDLELQIIDFVRRSPNGSFDLYASSKSPLAPIWWRRMPPVIRPIPSSSLENLVPSGDHRSLKFDDLLYVMVVASFLNLLLYPVENFYVPTLLSLQCAVIQSQMGLVGQFDCATLLDKQQQKLEEIGMIQAAAAEVNLGCVAGEVPFLASSKETPGGGSGGSPMSSDDVGGSGGQLNSNSAYAPSFKPASSRRSSAFGSTATNTPGSTSGGDQQGYYQMSSAGSNNGVMSPSSSGVGGGGAMGSPNAMSMAMGQQSPLAGGGGGSPSGLSFLPSGRQRHFQAYGMSDVPQHQPSSSGGGIPSQQSTPTSRSRRTRKVGSSDVIGGPSSGGGPPSSPSNSSSYKAAVMDPRMMGLNNNGSSNNNSSDPLLSPGNSPPSSSSCSPSQQFGMSGLNLSNSSSSSGRCSGFQGLLFPGSGGSSLGGVNNLSSNNNTSPSIENNNNSSNLLPTSTDGNDFDISGATKTTTSIETSTTATGSPILSASSSVSPNDALSLASCTGLLSNFVSGGGNGAAATSLASLASQVTALNNLNSSSNHHHHVNSNNINSNHLNISTNRVVPNDDMNALFQFITSPAGIAAVADWRASQQQQQQQQANNNNNSNVTNTNSLKSSNSSMAMLGHSNSGSLVPRSKIATSSSGELVIPLSKMDSLRNCNNGASTPKRGDPLGGGLAPFFTANPATVSTLPSGAKTAATGSSPRSAFDDPLSLENDGIDDDDERFDFGKFTDNDCYSPGEESLIAML